MTQLEKELLEALKKLARHAGALNTRQHAGLASYPGDWSDFYFATNEAKAVIAKAEVTP